MRIKHTHKTKITQIINTMHRTINSAIFIGGEGGGQGGEQLIAHHRTKKFAIILTRPCASEVMIARKTKCEFQKKI